MAPGNYGRLLFIDNVLLQETTKLDGYRFGFNGMEMDDEVAGSGNSYTAEFWQFDSRLGRRWNVDPIFKAFESSYVTISNNPLYYVDPFGDNAWHPEDDGTGTGNQKLVADEGDLDRNTGKVDQDRLRNYLDQTVGSGNYTSDQFNKWVEDAECNFNASDCNIVSVSLSSPNGQFNNLVGKYLINIQNTDPSWGGTKFKGNNCSPTTFNRVDQAVEFVYGKDYLGKLSISNPNYNAWQGNQTQGFRIVNCLDQVLQIN